MLTSIGWLLFETFDNFGNLILNLIMTGKRSTDTIRENVYKSGRSVS